MRNLLLLFLLLAGGLQLQAQAPDKTIDEKYTSALFRGGHAQTFYPLTDPAAVASFSIFQYLQGRVPGLVIYGSPMLQPAVFFRNARTALFLNEIRVDAGFLASVPMADVAYIKVFRPPFVGAFGGGAGGAIAVYTKEGDEGAEE